ncbi:MAG TPA: Uma2 family endonuclease [Candidatus Acidoferrales bacterium]|jgi:Uma2 family endonuclease|nr:Uma2 family endonuclease [Candidatus Acidoferrales bacterium]
MATLPDLITVEQFRQLPKGGEFAYELLDGRVVAVTRPKPRHWKLQRQLARLLEPKLKAFGEVATEVPFRPVAEFNLRAADVAVISHRRWEAIDPDDDLRGAPELVIEIKSPSNTQRKVQELARLCMENGAIQFWILDSNKKTVSVTHRDGSVVVYGPGSNIPLTAFGGGELAVDEIFG